MVNYKELDFTKIKKKDFNIKRSKTKQGIRKKSHAIFTFDIETTSFYANPETMEVEKFDYTKNGEYYKNLIKDSYCYIWMFSINDTVYYGRKLEEFRVFLHNLLIHIDCDIVIYSHNLAFEFQYISYYFEFDSVLARKTRKPMTASFTYNKNTVTLKCSYLLSNSSLANLSKNNDLPVKKMEGDLEYNELRHDKTTLTDKEMQYCENDCLVLYEYIKQETRKCRGLHDLPITSTGKIRRKYKEKLKSKGPDNLRNMASKISNLTPTTEEFKLLSAAFAGGYTHANATHANKIIYNVMSQDFTSSYPAVMLMEKVPMSRFMKPDILPKDIENLEKHFDEYAYDMTLKFTNITSLNANTFISSSKCSKIINGLYDNGRVAEATELIITISEQDYLIIKENYEYDDVEILDIIASKKGYMPIEMFEMLSELFEDKNKIKELLETDSSLNSKYNEVKALINGLYGDCVTNYISDVITFDGVDWHCKDLTDDMITEQLCKLEEDENLLKAYQWGVWITAYARRNIWKAIHEINEDVVYVDTDSIKYINHEKHENFIKEYNKECRVKLINVFKEVEMDPTSLIGIGEFDIDSKSKDENGNVSYLYEEFKTLGAKKYAYKDLNGLHITVSGVNKKTGVKALKSLDDFKEGLEFGYETSGSKTLHYTEGGNTYIMKDLNGVEHEITTTTGCCLQPTTYKVSIKEDYKYFITERKGNYNG